MAATIWKGRLNFGLVSIPIKLFRAARAEKIHMHKLQRESGLRVHQVFVPVENASSPEKPTEKQLLPDTPVKPESTVVHGAGNEPAGSAAAATPGLSPKEIVHGFEYDTDRYVQFEAEELAKIAPRSSPDMQILKFVRFAEVDPVYLETSYYVAPDTGGDKPYALLFEALKKTGYAAIGEMVMHRRDQIIVIRPGEHGLIAHTLFYEDEVKRDNEHHVASGLTGGKEMDLAIKLVDALAGKFEAGKFKDQYRERLRHAISEKVESGAVTQPATGAPKKPAIDIMAALAESLTRLKKPVKSEARPADSKRSKRSGGR
jgi:DNA end-binding protein Ku